MHIFQRGQGGFLLTHSLAMIVCWLYSNDVSLYTCSSYMNGSLRTYTSGELSLFRDPSGIKSNVAKRRIIAREFEFTEMEHIGNCCTSCSASFPVANDPNAPHLE